MEAYLETLRYEFNAEEDSFLLKLRTHLEWDQAAFARLIAAMQACCEHLGEAESVERWLAEGFWYMSWFVPEWSSHENFPRPYPPKYYHEAYARLFDMAAWFFQGESSYLPGSERALE